MHSLQQSTKYYLVTKMQRTIISPSTITSNIPTLENTRKLESEEIEFHLAGLNTQLLNAHKILQKEKDHFVLPYLVIVRNSIECLMLKHDLEGLNKVDFSLKISKNNSGFPTYSDFYLLINNKEKAKEYLDALPEREEIIDNLRNALFRGESGASAQIVLKRFNYYSRLAKTKTLKAYHFNEPKLIKEENERRLYTLEWSCIERATNLPALYRMSFTQNRSYAPLNQTENARLETIIYDTQLGALDIKTLAHTIDREIAELHPKFIEKHTIGPFYNSFTNNSDEIQIILPTPDSSVLKFTRERVLSIDVRQYGNILDRLRGKKTEQEIFGPIDYESRVIVPFRVKQKINTKPYQGLCKVYGITNEGEIV